MGKILGTVTLFIYSASMPQNGVTLDGRTVKRKREGRFLTQLGLAEKIGITVQTLGLIEANPDYRTSFRTVNALAEFFGCDPTELTPQPPEEVAS